MLQRLAAVLADGIAGRQKRQLGATRANDMTHCSAIEDYRNQRLALQVLTETTRLRGAWVSLAAAAEIRIFLKILPLRWLF